MTIRTVLLWVTVFLLFGCSEKLSQQEGTKRLIGRYTLHVGIDCQDKGIEYALLTLYSNGTYSQEGKFKNGESYHIDGRKWNYDGTGNVFFFDLKTIGTNASLIVDFHRPTVILLDPDLDCFFERNEGPA